jgi:predicted phosphodiesterase
MKYAVISDIHGNLEALNAVIVRAEAENIDKYICAGDIVGYNANPVECLELVRSLDLLAVVRGNNDEYAGSDMTLEGVNEAAEKSILWTRQQLAGSDREWLLQLDLKEVKNEENITVVHGTLDSPGSWGYIYDEYHAEDNFSYQTTQVCFCGHSHIPVLFRKGFSFESNTMNVVEVSSWKKCPVNETEITISVDFGCKYLANIGSVGQPRNGDPRASFVIYDSDKRELKRICVDYDIAATQNKIREAGLPEILALRLENGT